MMPEQTQRSATRGASVRRIAFWVAVALASLFLLAALFPAYPLIVINWFPKDVLLAVRPNLVVGDEVHRLHSLALGVLAWGMLLGIVLQVHRPARKVSPLLASLAVPIAIAASEALAGTFTVVGTAPFLVLILAVIVLHPAIGDIVRLPQWSLPMLGLGAVAALPWVMYATRIGTAVRKMEPGYEVDHLTFMGALALVAVLWGIIGASNHTGWHYAAGASVAATACMGLQSVIFTDVFSGLSPSWAAAALVWCIVYGGTAILRARGTGSNDSSTLGTSSLGNLDGR